MGYSITLRTLTEKSVLGFGYESTRDLRIRDIITLGKSSQLIRAYYGLGKITFTDELLDELLITKDLRIDKPGKLPLKERNEAVSKVMDVKYRDISENQRMGMAAKKKARIKRARNLVEFKSNHASANNKSYSGKLRNKI
jgi:hypothetical protein